MLSIARKALVAPLFAAMLVLAIVEIAIVLGAGVLLLLGDRGVVDPTTVVELLGEPDEVGRRRIAWGLVLLALCLASSLWGRRRPPAGGDTRMDRGFRVIVMLVLADAFWRPAVDSRQGGLVLALGLLMALMTAALLASPREAQT